MLAESLRGFFTFLQRNGASLKTFEAESHGGSANSQLDWAAEKGTPP